MNVRKFWVLLAGLLVLGAVGCGETGWVGSGGAAGSATAGSGGGAGSGAAGGGGGDAGSGGTGGKAPVCTREPRQGPVEDACGIWVSATLGDDANEGTQAAPVKTLTRAVELAAAGTGRIYACAETYHEALVFPADLSMHGGFDCADGWAFVAEEKLGGDRHAVLTADADQFPLMYVEGKTTAKGLVSNFFVKAADSAIPSGSSIAVFVRDDVELEMAYSTLEAGNAMPGLDGLPGDMWPAPPDGLPGNKGADACSAAVSKGGASPESSCVEGRSRGGAGGDASTMIASDGKPGEPAGGMPGGAGGLGEQNSPLCTGGQPGANGAPGAFGLGGAGNGRLTFEGYRGYQGEDGRTGEPGHGGGGGGGTFGKASVCGTPVSGGAAGGSGGSGGCGGRGGQGGQPGGISAGAAIRSRLPDITFDFVVGRPAQGGKGGDGGAPQKGAKGGSPGPGGAGAGSINPGCSGGSGGDGGRGGWGGGGQGGDAPCWTRVLTKGVGGFLCVPGSGGAGGIGDPFQSAGKGAHGAAGGGLVVDYSP